MVGLVPAICTRAGIATDGRDKPGHDVRSERRQKVILFGRSGSHPPNDVRLLQRLEYRIGMQRIARLHHNFQLRCLYG